MRSQIMNNQITNNGTIRKCFTIYLLRTKPEIEKYEPLLQNGWYQGCEIFYPFTQSLDHQREYFEAVMTLINKYPVEVVLHLPYGSVYNIATKIKIDETMKILKDGIDYAHRFNATKLTLHPGELVGDLTKEEALSLAIQNTKELGEYAGRMGMKIVVENLPAPSNLCVTKEEMKYFLEAVNLPNVLLNIDCGHVFASGERDLAGYVYYLKDYVTHLHINDNSGTDTHGLIGTGLIDFESYFKALKGIHYEGLFCAEVIHKDIDDLIVTSKVLDEIWRRV